MLNLTHLFISGSHLWGLYNFGIIRYMQAYPKYFDKINDYGGVSFGAITAYLLILNINIERIEKMFYSFLENEDFKLISYDKFINIIYDKGIQNISLYFDLFENELKEFKNLTFIDISKKFGKNLHILALCIHTGELTLFNTDNTPNVIVIDAIKASSSVPILSTPIEIDGYLYCDPCITNNTILDFFTDIPKNQILSIIHKFNNNIKKYEKGYNFTTIEYYINLINIYHSKQSYIATGNNINDYTLVINNHESFINFSTNEDGFYINISKKSLDIGVLYGFKLMTDWVKKHYKE